MGFDGLDTFATQSQATKETAPYADIAESHVVDGVSEALLTSRYGELTAEAINHKLGANISMKQIGFTLESWIEAGAVRKCGDIFELRID